MGSGEAALPAEYFIRDWSMIGPFSFRDTAYAKPEGDPRILEEEFVADEAGLNPGDDTQGWSPIERRNTWMSEFLTPVFHLARDGEHVEDVYKRTDYSVAYFGAVVMSPGEIPDAMLLFGASDYTRIWWNGKEIYRYGGPLRGCTWDCDRVPLRVREGENTLVVKSCNYPAAWQLCAQLADRDGNPLRIHSEQAARVGGEGLKIEIVARERIQHVYGNMYIPYVFVKSNGDVLLGEYMDEGNRRFRLRAGSDQWQRTTPSLTGAFVSKTCAELPDGSLYMVQGPLKNVARGGFSVSAYRTDPDGETYHGPFTVPVHMPGARDYHYGDQGIPAGAGVAFFSMVRLKDGRLLAAMHGYWEGDSDYDEDAVDAGFDVVKCGFTKTRVAAAESTDEGKSWHYLGMMGHAPELGREGFVEPAVAELANGDLLAVMRNGAKEWPLWRTRSTDGGKTWSRPEKLPMLGVFPQLKLLSNGVLVLAHVRPALNLSFDPTGTGNHWTHHVVIQPTRIGEGGGVLSIDEQKPNTVLFPVYDEFPIDPTVRRKGRDTKALHLGLLKIRVERTTC